MGGRWHGRPRFRPRAPRRPCDHPRVSAAFCLLPLLLTATPVPLPASLRTLPSTLRRQDTVRLDDTHSVITSEVRDPAQPAVTFTFDAHHDPVPRVITGLTAHTDLTGDDHRTAETAARLLGVTAGACLGFTEKTLDRLATRYETLNPAAPYHNWTHGRFAASVRLEASLLKANTASFEFALRRLDTAHQGTWRRSCTA